MRHASILSVLAVSVGIPFAAAVNAQQATQSPPAGPADAARPTLSANAAGSPGNAAANAPTGGRAFGEHVSGMAPEHPRMHGRHFGECVSDMATTGECPHHDLE